MSGGWSKQICHCSSQFRKIIHRGTLQDCPQRLSFQGRAMWALESLQRPKWGWAGRSKTNKVVSTKKRLRLLFV